MALSVIIALYICIGLMSAAGSVALSRLVFSPRAEQIFFGLFLVPIAGFYLAFNAHLGDEAAWGLEAAAVAVFAVLGLLGTRVTPALILGYVLHGLWDLLHELHAHAAMDLGTATVTDIPLAYGFFCVAYDWCMAAYFYTRRHAFRTAWSPAPPDVSPAKQPT